MVNAITSVELSTIESVENIANNGIHATLENYSRVKRDETGWVG